MRNLILRVGIALGGLVSIGLLVGTGVGAKVVLPFHASERFHIVSVGVNRYQKPYYENQVAGAVNDARAIAEAFSVGARTFNAQVTTAVLADEGASRRAIEAAMAGAVRDVKPDDTFVFFFAGLPFIPDQVLKTSNPALEEFYLAPGGLAAVDSWDKIDKSQLISIALLHSWITQVKALRQIVIFDSGYSDSIVGTFHGYLSREARSVQDQTDKNIVVLASSGEGHEQPDAAGVTHGVLTQSLVAGLSGKGAFNGFVTARSLEAYLHSALLNFDRQFAVTLGQGREDFPLAAVAKAAGAEARADEPARGVTVQPVPSDSTLVSARPAAGTQYALLFATDHYDEWSRLANPIADATEVAKELKESYGFRVDLVADPTRVQVLDKIREYAKKTYAAGDELFIFFAGHGNYDEEQQRGFVITRDSRRNDRHHDTELPQTTLREIIDAIPARHIFLALDVCFGGAFDPRIGESGNRGDDNYGTIDLREFIRRKRALKTRLFLTSGSKEYVPDGRPGQHSPFARALLEALRTYGGADGVLTLAKALPHFELLKTVPRNGDFGRNEPGSEFLFISNPALR